MSFFLNCLIFVINNVELSCIDDELNLKVTMDENILCAFICAKVLIILQCMPKTLENKLWFFQIVFLKNNFFGTNVSNPFKYYDDILATWIHLTLA